MSVHPALAALLRELDQRQRHSHRDERVRLAVRLRARDACEYCLLPSIGEFHVDHIVPPGLWDAYARGALPGVPPIAPQAGPEHLDNFAWACAFCNTAKGRRAAGRSGRVATRLFNPRHDHWPDHFAYFHTYLLIRGISPIGRATEVALGFNDPRLSGALAQRHEEIIVGRYPPTWAAGWTAAGGTERRP